MSATCSTCGAHIVWVITPTGKKMPVDAAPSERGTLRVFWDDGADSLRAVVDRGHEGDRYLSHFATCAHANDHRRVKG